MSVTGCKDRASSRTVTRNIVGGQTTSFYVGTDRPLFCISLLGVVTLGVELFLQTVDCPFVDIVYIRKDQCILISLQFSNHLLPHLSIIAAWSVVVRNVNGVFVCYVWFKHIYSLNSSIHRSIRIYKATHEEWKKSSRFITILGWLKYVSEKL